MNTLLRTLLYEWKERKLPPIIERDKPLDLSLNQKVHNATVITGFRRVGKTYLLFEAIHTLLKTHSRDELIYINFEDERVVDPSTDILTDLIPEIQAVFGKKPQYIFLDELQLVPHWSKWVRRILDTEESIQLFITGSSSKMSSAELPTELRGRAWEVKVSPLSFMEFLRFKNTSIDFKKLIHIKDEMARFLFFFDEFLTFGALPAVVLTPPEKKQELLQSYFHTVVQKDVAERHKIDSNTILKTLLKLLLNSSYITISKLFNSIKSMGIPVGKSTIDTYLSYIESSYFMRELPIFNASVINQLSYPRKIYFIDTGFITALSTKFSKNMGRLFENVIYNKLARENASVYYYKDSADNEVDFALLDDGKVTALYQVCYDLTDEDTQKREIQSLLKAGKKLNCANLNLITIQKPTHFTPPKEITILQGEEIV